MLPITDMLPSWNHPTCLALVSLAVMAPAVLGSDAPPVNDQCDQPTVLTPGSIAFSNLEADTDGPGISSCVTLGSSQIYNDVWYEFTATQSGTLHVSTCGQATFDTRISVYVGDCDSLIEIGCNDDGYGCDGYTSSLLSPSLQGERYLIRVGSFHPSQRGEGTLTLSLESPCFLGCDENVRSELEVCGQFANDGCNGGLLGSEGQDLFRDVPSGHESIELNESICGQWHFDGTIRDTDWYRIVIPEPGANLSLVLESSDFVEANLYIASESCPLDLLQYEAGGCPTVIDLEWVPAGAYQIIVAPGFEQVIFCDGPYGMDRYMLSVNGEVSTENAPVNDDCTDALVVEDGLHDFSTFYATTDGPSSAPEECGEFGTGIGADIWFDYVAGVDGQVTASVCGLADFDTRLEVRQGGCDGPLVACNDDSPECADFTSTVSFSSSCGELYSIRVGGYEAARGDGKLDLSSEGSCCLGDLDGDGMVAGGDLATLLAMWGSDDATADFNGDGIVSGADLAAILAAWGPC